MNKTVIVLTTMLASMPQLPSYCPSKTLPVPTMNTSNPDIILRIGEYPDKPGKRLTLPTNESYPLPVKYNSAEDNYYICEYYFNQKIARALYQYLKANNVNVILQDTQSKKEDLNAAGRIAKQKNPLIYLSIHTNSYEDSSSGYFFLTNEGDNLSKQIANQLSFTLKDNQLIPQRQNRIQNGYIGELNVKPGKINILGEFGFFSNKDEARRLSSDQYVNYVAKNMGDELIKIIKTLNN